MHNDMVKVVTGIRRCGKTYLLFNLFGDYLRSEGVDDDHLIEVALDVDENAGLRDPSALFAYLRSKITNGREQYYVFLDEVQYAISREELKNPDVPPRLYGVLNGLLRMRNVDIYVTGSNSKLLSHDVMTEFRDRGDEVCLRPLSFSEFMQAFEGDRYQGWAEYTVYGGMPLVLSMRTDEQKARYHSATHGGTHTDSSALSINFRYLYNINNITRFSLMTGMILALSMIQVMMLAALSISREREDGTFDMMLMSPLTPLEILIGKAIPPTIIAVCQGLVMFLICVLWFEIPFNGNFGALLTVITIFSLCTVGIGLAISALANTAQQSIVMSFTLVLPSIILSGLITPRSAMPELIQYLALLNPYYYGLNALHRIYLEGQSFAQVAHLLLPLLGLGAITMISAAWLFKGKLG